MDNAKIQVETNEKFTIDQEEDWCEALTCGCLVADREFQMSINPAMTGSREVIMIKEDANFICKCFLHPRCRSYKGVMTSSEGQEVMFTYEKPCGIPICSFCRPEFEVYDHEQRKIGKIKNECSICEMKMHILDPSDQPLYTVTGTMCSIGFCCEPLCGSCFPLSFSINNERTGGTTISQFKKKSKGLFIECCLNSDKFEIIMPAQMNYHERILLAAAIHEINMMWFERKSPCIFFNRN
jgi:hypothetical protein